MPAPEMKPVQSSYVAALGYDPAAQEFYVQWNSGQTSVYSQVPALVASDVTNAPSIGKAIHAQIKGQYPHRYSDE